jgi:hypothetical protein
MQFKFKLLIILAISCSCARMATLNKKSHNFSETPNHIIWIQVAGLSEEHLAFTKFNPQNISKKSILEDASCIGKAWSYNLSTLRPKALQGFMSQITGSKNITGGCEDLKQAAIWEFFAKGGYASALLESDGDKQSSLSNLLACEGAKEYFKDVSLTLMSPMGVVEGEFYHFENNQFNPKNGKLYFDKSCQKGNCFSSLHTNAKHIYKNFLIEKTKTVFIVKDHSFQTALLKQDRAKMIETLENLEDMIRYFMSYHGTSEKSLLLISGTGSRNVEMPEQGPEWGKLLDKKTDLLYKRNSLLTPIWAMGSRAENFCGFYEEDEIFERVFWSSDNTTLDLSRLF